MPPQLTSKGLERASGVRSRKVAALPIWFAPIERLGLRGHFKRRIRAIPIQTKEIPAHDFKRTPESGCARRGNDAPAAPLSSGPSLLFQPVLDGHSRLANSRSEEHTSE